MAERAVRVYWPRWLLDTSVEGGWSAEIGFEGPKDKGRFMKEWMARYKGRAEGRDVQAALG